MFLFDFISVLIAFQLVAKKSFEKSYDRKKNDRTKKKLTKNMLLFDFITVLKTFQLVAKKKF